MDLQPEKKLKKSLVEWQRERIQLNDENIKAGKVYYPVWQITSKKRIRMEFDFESGSRSILLEEVPANFDFSKLNTLKLDIVEWSDLYFRREYILRFIDAMDGSTTVEDILKCWKIAVSNNWCSCIVPVNEDICLNFNWKSDKSIFSAGIQRMKISCRENVRYGLRVAREKQDWATKNEGITFYGEALKLFAVDIMPKVRNGLRMWVDMSHAGHHLWISLLSDYKSKKGKGKRDWVPLNAVEDGVDETDVPFSFCDQSYPFDECDD